MKNKCEMAYKTNIGFEAAAVPALLELWLAENLPADFTIKQRKCQGLRVVEITVTGSTLQDLQCKRGISQDRKSGRLPRHNCKR